MNKKQSKDLDYCKRYELDFRRKILKKEIRDDLYEIRKKLFKDGLPLELRTVKQFEMFDNALAEILFNKRRFLNLLNLCYPIMDKAEIPKCHLYPFMIFLMTGKVSKKYFRIEIAEIESEEMTKLALGKAKASSNNFLKRFLAGDFNFLFSNWPDLHPIYIKISPYADSKEINNFIIKNWKQIEDHQKLYGKRYLKNMPSAKLLVLMDMERKQGKEWKEIKNMIDKMPELEDYKDLECWEYSKIYSKAKKRKII